jgi:hypothetical protein
VQADQDRPEGCQPRWLCQVAGRSCGVPTNVHGNLVTDRPAASTAGLHKSAGVGSKRAQWQGCTLMQQKAFSTRLGAVNWRSRPLPRTRCTSAVARDAQRDDPGLATTPNSGNIGNKGLLRYKPSKLVIIAIAATALFGVIGGFVGHSLRAPVLNLVFAPPNNAVLVVLAKGVHHWLPMVPSRQHNAAISAWTRQGRGISRAKPLAS